MNKTLKTVLAIMCLVLLVASLATVAACKKEYTVNIAQCTNGSVVADKTSYVKGEEATITVTASNGYVLSSLKVDGAEKAADLVNGQLKITMTANVEVVATFKAIPTYTVTITEPQYGQVIADKNSYREGATATISVKAAAGYKLTSILVDGAEKVSQVANGKLTFTVTKNVTVTATFEPLPPVDVTVTIPANVNMNGMSLTLTAEGKAPVSVTVADGKFVIPQAEYNSEYVVTGMASGVMLNFGKVIVAGETASLDAAANFTTNRGTMDFATGTYNYLSGAKNGFTFRPVAGSIAEGDVWVATKMIMNPVALNQIINSGKGEVVFGLQLMSGDDRVLTNIRIKGGETDEWVREGGEFDISNGTGDSPYVEQDVLRKDGALTAYGNALVGDGLYFVNRYEASTGMVYTYLGATIDGVTLLRHWGTAAAQSFDANSIIDGFAVGYFNDWGTDEGTIDVTFANTRYGATIAEALGLTADVVLSEDSPEPSNGTISVAGKPYGDVVITFTPATDYAVGTVLVNGEQVTLAADNTYTLTNYTKQTVKVEATFANTVFAITATGDDNLDIVITTEDGTPVTNLNEVRYGTRLVIEAKAKDGYMLAEDSFVIASGSESATHFVNKVIHVVVGNTTISATSVAAATISGTISAEHYDEYIDNLTVGVASQKADSTNVHTGVITKAESGFVHNWTITVPASYAEFVINITDSEGRFRPIEIELGDTATTAVGESKLLPMVEFYNLWPDNQEVANAAQVTYDAATGNVRLGKSEFGNTLDATNWWGGNMFGATFTAIDSKYWVMETVISNVVAGAYNQFQAGLTIGNKEFILVMDRDQQLAAFTEWDPAIERSVWVDMISDAKAQRAGIVADSTFNITITAIRSNNTVYVFINGQLVGDYAISASQWPTLNNNNSNKLGFMVKTGTQATFSNYWYELGEDVVDAYLAGKALNLDATVQKTGLEIDSSIPGATIQIYKQNGASKWEPATEADYIVGALLKLKVTVSNTGENSFVLGDVTIDGAPITLDNNNEYVFTLSADTAIAAVVDVKELYSVTVGETQNATVEVTAPDGSEIDLAKIPYGTQVLVTVTPGENCLIKGDGIVITCGDDVQKFSQSTLYTVLGNATITASAEEMATISGTLDATHYNSAVEGLVVTAQDGAYTGAITPAQSGNLHTWTVVVPKTLSDITVKISDPNGKFEDTLIELGDTSVADASGKLVAKLVDYIYYEEVKGHATTVYDPATQSARIQFTQSGAEWAATPDNGNTKLDTWWGSGKQMGATFVGVKSKYWVMETTLSDMTIGGWTQYQAGITIGEKTFIMLLDRDRQGEIYTEWNIPAGKAGSHTDILTYEQAEHIGISRGGWTNWAGDGKTMKIAAVRDNDTIYLFLQDLFVGAYKISADLMPNINDIDTEHLGMYVRAGTQVTFSNYWYELGEENVDAYLNSTKATLTTNVVKSGDQVDESIPGATVEIYKQNLVSTDGSYNETTEWVKATEADLVKGAMLKLVVTPSVLENHSFGIKVEIDGKEVTLTNNACVFTLGKDSTIDVSVEISGPFTANVAVNDQVNLNGVTLNFVDASNSSNTFTKVVEEGAFAIENQLAGTTYNVTAVVDGVNWNLGQLVIEGKAIEWNPVEAMTSNGNDSVDLVNSTYVVNPSTKHEINFNLANPITGNAYFVAKLKLDAQDLATLMASNADQYEVVFGIGLKSADHSATNAIQLKASDGANCWMGGHWTEAQGAFFTKTATAADRQLTALGQALVGDGLWYGVFYDAATGMTVTYYGTSAMEMVRLRDWGNYATNSLGSFNANTAITGFSIGYVDSWGRNPFSLYFSNVGYGATLAEALNLADVVLADDSNVVGGTATVAGKPYGNVEITLAPTEAGATHGAVLVNGEEKAVVDGKITLTNYTAATVKVEVTFSTDTFAIDGSAISNATITVVDASGANLDATAIPYGTVATITVVPSENTVVVGGSLQITMGANPAVTAEGATYTIRVLDNITLVAQTQTSVTLTGTIDANGYGAYADELIVSAGEGAYTGSVTAGENDTLVWTVSVLDTLEDKSVSITTANNRFRDIATADQGTSKLVPAMSEFIFSSMGAQSGWMNLNYNQDTEAYSFTRSATSGTFTQNWDSCDWANKYAAYTFNGINSDHWVISATFTGLEYGIYQKTQAGFLVGDNQILYLAERDKQLTMISAGDWSGGHRIISEERAATFGLLGETGQPYSTWGHGSDTMKITAVRDGNDVYVFLQDQFICKQTIGNGVWASLENNASTKLGFVTNHGIQATFTDYWYTESATDVDNYLASQKLSAPSVAVTESGDSIEVEGATYTIQKQNADGSWVAATDADYYVGAYLKLVATPASVQDVSCVLAGIKHNGETKSLTNNAYVFNYGKDDTLEILVTVEAPINVVVTINDQVLANGVTLTLTNYLDDSDVRTLAVDGNTFQVDSVARGSSYNVMARVAGIDVSLGTVTLDGTAVDWNPASAFTSGSGVVDLSTNTYNVVGSEKGRVDFNAINGTITAGDVWVGTKIQISQSALDTLLANSNSENNEAVFGIEMRSASRAVENVIRIESGAMQLWSGDWAEALSTWTEESKGISYDQILSAIAGDGLYFVMKYAASSGMTYTYIGDALDNLVFVRDWGTGGSDDPGWRSFEANSVITGIGLGYVHCWKGDNAKCPVTFSDVFVAKSQGGLEAQGETTLMDWSGSTAKWAYSSSSNTIDGTAQKNSKGTASKNTTVVYGNEAASIQYTINSVNGGKTIVAGLEGVEINDLSKYSKITFRIKIDSEGQQEGFALNVTPKHSSSTYASDAWVTITTDEWVEVTFDISAYPQYGNSTSPYWHSNSTTAFKGVGLVFRVADTENMTIQNGLTMYISNFVLS